MVISILLNDPYFDSDLNIEFIKEEGYRCNTLFASIHALVMGSGSHFQFVKTEGGIITSKEEFLAELNSQAHLVELMILRVLHYRLFNHYPPVQEESNLINLCKTLKVPNHLEDRNLNRLIQFSKEFKVDLYD